jgi:hypothetical protein
MTTQNEEEKEIDKRKKSNSRSRTSKRGEKAGGTGNNETGSIGGSGGEVGGSGSETGQSGNETGNSEGNRKQQLLQKLKRERNKRNSGISNEEYNDIEGKSTGIDSRDGGTSTGIESVSGTDTGTVDELAGTERQLNVDNSNTNGDNPSSETNSRGRKRKIKGVEFELPSFEGSTPSPPAEIVKEEQLANELTQKESKEMLPKLQEAMKLLFAGMDKSIDLTLKQKVDGGVHIWGNIEEYEIKIMCVSLLEAGQSSKIVSTITRRVVADFSKLQIGIILFPRFLDTYSVYMKNGFGFGYSQNQIGGK